MITIALIGLDGAGKTTISRQVVQQLPFPVKYIYMGVNSESSNYMLPTTRLAAAIKHSGKTKSEWKGSPDPDTPQVQTKGLVKQTFSGMRAALRLSNRLAEEWYRQGLSWYYMMRGNVVLYDRHFFFDYYSNDIAPTQGKRPLTRKIHGFILEYVYPKPDLVIMLDAPAEVVYQRKGEGTLESLEKRRQEYFKMQKYVNCFNVVDATQPQDKVLEDVMRIIRGFTNQAKTARKVGNVLKS